MPNVATDQSTGQSRHGRDGGLGTFSCVMCDKPCLYVSCLGFVVRCMARYRDHPQWVCRGRRCMQTSRGEPRAGNVDKRCRTGSRRSRSMVLVEIDSRLPEANRHDKRDRGAGARGSAGRGCGGCDPRDAEVPALSKHVAEMQRKTTARPLRQALTPLLALKVKARSPCARPRSRK